MVSRVCDILDMQKNRNLPQLRPNLNNFRSGDMRINNSLIIDMSKLRNLPDHNTFPFTYVNGS